MTAKEEWVIWNGSLGVLDMVTIGRIEDADSGRTALLAPPYGVVGPFSLDELETQGRIVFGACLVMSRHRLQEDQVDLRREAQALPRRQLFRLSIDDEREYREVLNLPLQGALEPSEINSAFRKARQDLASRRRRRQRRVPPHHGGTRRPRQAVRGRLVD